MDFYVNSALAQRYGIKEAIVLDVIDEEICNKEQRRESKIYGSYFCRMSAKMLSANVPMITKSSAARVLRYLVDEGVLSRARYNAHPFDMTYSYTFTEYGRCVMEAAYAGR